LTALSNKISLRVFIHTFASFVKNSKLAGRLQGLHLFGFPGETCLPQARDAKRLSRKELCDGKLKTQKSKFKTGSTLLTFWLFHF
jgi:hypothetical protein